MKKILGIFLVFIILFSSSTISYAHPGRTDSSGGHYCRTNCEKWGLSYGEYHYHNGGSPTGSSSSKSKNNVIKQDPYAEAEKLVKVAESYAGSLKWQISIDYRKSKYPSNPVSQVDMKLFNNTKNALNKAHTRVNSLYDYSLTDRVEKVEIIYNQAVTYIDAINAGIKLFSKFEQYREKYKLNPNSTETKKIYNELMGQAKKTNIMIYRVYGKSTREAMLQKYNVNKWLHTLN